MDLTADRLQSHQLIDEVIEEPLGGAHCDPELISERIKASLMKNLKTSQALSIDDLLEERYQYWIAKGRS